MENFNIPVKKDTENEVQCPICGSHEIAVGGSRGEFPCSRCQQLVEKAKITRGLGLDRKRRLTKAQKRSLWSKKGKVCEMCGVSNIGGSNYAIHPFRPADWDGTLDTVRVLCATCLGEAAGERDRIFQYLSELDHMV